MIKDQNASYWATKEKLMVSVSLNLTRVNHGVFDRTGIKDQQKIAKKKIKKPQTAIELRHEICFL